MNRTAWLAIINSLIVAALVAACSRPGGGGPPPPAQLPVGSPAPVGPSKPAAQPSGLPVTGVRVALSSQTTQVLAGLSISPEVLFALTGNTPRQVEVGVQWRHRAGPSGQAEFQTYNAAPGCNTLTVAFKIPSAPPTAAASPAAQPTPPAGTEDPRPAAVRAGLRARTMEVLHIEFTPAGPDPARVLVIAEAMYTEPSANAVLSQAGVMWQVLLETYPVADSAAATTMYVVGQVWAHYNSDVRPCGPC
jgi:hypothetical protein